MSIKRIGDVNPPCRHPEHLPPSNQLFIPGTYENTCPGCGEVTTFQVRGIFW